MTEAEVIEKIENSREFRSSEDHAGLLRHIYEEGAKRRLTARDIEEYLYPPGQKAANRSKTQITAASGATIPLKRSDRKTGTRKPDAANGRERISQLKEYLRRYYSKEAFPHDDVVCSISDGREGKGYYLIFEKVDPNRVATMKFWEPHFKSKGHASLVVDSLLFFYEHSIGSIIRYMNVNIEGNNRFQALEMLKNKHPEHKDHSLVAGHLYIDVGAVAGAEVLRNHFAETRSQQVPLIIEKDSKGKWDEGSPIFLAGHRTNTFLHKLFGSEDAAPLTFRSPDEPYASVTITGVTERERKRISEFHKSIEWNGEETFTTNTPEWTLGIVSRVKNPRGAGGIITSIASDATWSIKQMAILLSEEELLRKLLDEMKWSYVEPPPETFELLFLIQLWPGNADDVAKQPILMSWRPISQAQ